MAMAAAKSGPDEARSHCFWALTDAPGARLLAFAAVRPSSQFGPPLLCEPQAPLLNSSGNGSKSSLYTAISHKNHNSQLGFPSGSHHEREVFENSAGVLVYHESSVVSGVRKPIRSTSRAAPSPPNPPARIGMTPDRYSLIWAQEAPVKRPPVGLLTG